MPEPAHNPPRPAGYPLPATTTIPPSLPTDAIWPSALWNATAMRATVPASLSLTSKPASSASSVSISTPQIPKNRVGWRTTFGLPTRTVSISRPYGMARRMSMSPIFRGRSDSLPTIRPTTAWLPSPPTVSRCIASAIPWLLPTKSSSCSSTSGAYSVPGMPSIPSLPTAPDSSRWSS